jgi:hypothetical protein
MTEDENILLKKQLEELREQLNTKDLEIIIVQSLILNNN